MKKALNTSLSRQIETSILGGEIHEDRGDKNSSLVVCAANTDRFNARHFSTPMTAYTVGWRDPENLDELLEFIAPAVPVPMRFSFKRMLNGQIFLSEIDDIRAIGSAFKRVEYGGTEQEARTFNKGLTIRVDHDDAVGPDWQERYTSLLLQRLIRNDLRRAVALILAAANNLAVTWDDESNPDKDLRKMLRRTKNATGMRANRVLMGGAAWEGRQDAYESAIDMPRFSRADKSPEQLASYLMVNGVKVSEAVYQSGVNAKSDIMGQVAVAYNARPGVTKDDPSHIKRFVTPTTQGTHRVYVHEHDKFTDLSVEHYSNNIVTVAEGIEKLTITLPA